MTDLHKVLEQFKEKAKEVEKNVTQSLSNHHGMIGYQAAILDVIKIITKAIEAVDPDSTISEILEIGEALLNEGSSE